MKVVTRAFSFIFHVTIFISNSNYGLTFTVCISIKFYTFFRIDDGSYTSETCLKD